MKALEIKEKRLSLGLTQKVLAELIGVSTQTINGYENGKEIPSTKYQILDTILNKGISNIVKEPPELYTKNQSGFNEKISQIEERIKEHEEICNLLFDNPEGIKHQKELIRLLNMQINLIQKAKKDKANDLIL
jgi:transcriptional regulator with XRE-family HTH domain